MKPDRAKQPNGSRTHICYVLARLFSVMFVIICLGCGSFASKASAQTIIRDTEIENVLREWMAPLLKSADLGPKSINLVLVQSPDINAFVAGGANIFIYTGLIDASETPEEVMGVLAHELGHVIGGHLIGGRDALEKASFESILGTVLGIGAAVLSGNGEIANAIISGTGAFAQGKYLAHSRVNESAADQAALRLMNGAQINPQGLKTFLQKLESEELLPRSKQSEYVRTHPVTSNRINALEAKIKQSRFIDDPTPDKRLKQHQRMKAKLLGFIDPGRVVWTYNDTDQSVPALYARAIAGYRQNHVDEALGHIDRLIGLEPYNPYFQELKGQILLGFGRVEAAIPYYKTAAETAPNASLIRIDLAKALLEKDQSETTIKEAIRYLERASIDEPRSSRVHRLFATAYGRIGNEPMTKLHLAEEAVLQRRLAYAKGLLEQIESAFENGSRADVQRHDLVMHIGNLEQKTR